MKQVDVVFQVEDDKISELQRALYKMQGADAKVLSFSRHDFKKNNTIAEIAELFYKNNIDIDVWDTEIDMCVAFVLDLNDSTNGSYYGKFMMLLAKNVEVNHIGKFGMTCEFSRYFAQHADKVNKYVKENIGLSGGFFDNELYLELTENLESLIAGYGSENEYQKLCEALTDEEE